MRDALSAPEIASLAGHLDVPGSLPGVHKRLKRDAWPSRRRSGQGGGKEYPIAGWPAPLRQALMDAISARVPAVCAVLEVPIEPAVPAALPAAVPLPAVPAEPLPPATALADWQRRSLEARLALLAEVDRLALAGTWRKAAVLVERKARAGTLAPELLRLVPVANARSGGGEGGRTLSLRTLYRWAAQRETAVVADTWSALAPKEAPKIKAARPWEAALLSLYRQPQQRGIPWCLEQMETRFPGLALPSYDQAKRFIAGLPPVERERGRRGPNALLALKGFRRRDTSMLAPMDVVVADGHTVKFDVAHPVHGRPFGPEVMAVQDRATRYIAGWSAGLAESTWVVMDGIRNAVAQLGMIAIFYTDNGSGFVNAAMSDEVLGFLSRLHMTQERATAQRAQARGGIERSHQSIWVRGARGQVTYRGRDMDREARKAVTKLVETDIRETGASALLMGWPEFLAWCQEQVDAYNHRPHRALAKVRDAVTGRYRHMSPAECLQSWRDKGWEPVPLADAEMDDLFRPYEERRSFRGEVRLPWGHYYDRALEAFHGRDVRVGYDIHDGGRVWVRDQDGRLICVAKRGANVVPDMPSSKVEHARDKRARGRAKIAHDKLHLIELERRGGLVIDHVPAEPITIEQQAAADAMLARLERAAPTEAPIRADGARPTFGDDLSWARWLAEHPGQATEHDRAYLADRLRGNSFRFNLEAEGVDLALLLTMVRCPPPRTRPRTTQPTARRPMRDRYVKTSNTTRFLSGVADVLDRGAEEANLLVVDGLPGLGKTETIQWWATQQGALFLRAKQGWTPSWMLRELLGELSVAPAHTFERMYRQSLEALSSRAREAERAKETFGVVIDEVDHISRRTDMLETLRDLSDFLEIPFILVGMDKVRANLTRFPQIASRVSRPVEFQACTLDDVQALVAGLCEVEAAPDLVTFLHRASDGYVREIKEGIKNIEKHGRRNPGAVTLQSMAGQVLLIDRKTGRPVTVRE